MKHSPSTLFVILLISLSAVAQDRSRTENLPGTQDTRSSTSNASASESTGELSALAVDQGPFIANSIPDQFMAGIPTDEMLTNASMASGDANRFRGDYSSAIRAPSVGLDLYSSPDFEDGLLVVGNDVAMKIGGYVKADFIYDFEPIDSTDTFDTSSIPVDAPHRTNARFHARQTRISFDTRWASNDHGVRIFVESDFFGEGDGFRLRHAYGESGPVLVGQTWTTFTDVAAAPATLDMEGSVSSVNRRQAQARWTQSILGDEGLTFAIAVEDTRFIIESPVPDFGEARSPSPDFVTRVRLKRDWGQFQLANLYRVGGFQPTGEEVRTGSAWGVNFTGVLFIGDSSKAYYQVLVGDGIGSYRGLPDAVLSSTNSAESLRLFAWMTGITRDWNNELSSNFTYGENRLSNAPSQNADAIHRTTYLSANLIWSPLQRIKVGVEYLYGLRENRDGGIGLANRTQMAFVFDLP